MLSYDEYETSIVVDGVSSTLTSSLSGFVIGSTNHLYYFQRLLKLTQPTPKWIPAPEKRRSASETHNDIKITPVVDDALHTSMAVSRDAVKDVNGNVDHLSPGFDNPVV